ncbi:hypothetical protein [Dyadobacter pollutisoli]|jgi:hypothetical protein|uniref:Uncharacterized protein n=1 Tax=Dyadobacter pollutisoli TaxID=2910158 RepID=A0A9E8NGH4_9BACT|nr:hypothetical protein [Dyadobacter pollutisoli]WAC14557.1 hypothetical protein ON006_11475 [Dyadobacter pollutisoli]
MVALTGAPTGLPASVTTPVPLCSFGPVSGLMALSVVLQAEKPGKKSDKIIESYSFMADIVV